MSEIIYIATSTEQHPLTGELIPVFKTVTKDTTIGEIIEWYRTLRHGKGKIYDLRISEPDQS